MYVDELQAKMAAHSGVIHIREEDEFRLTAKTMQAAANMKFNVMRWTYSEGITAVAGVKLNSTRAGELRNITDPQKLLARIKEWQDGPTVLIAFDFVTLANRLPSLPIIARLLKDINVKLQTARGAAECQLILCDQADLDIQVSFQKLTLELPTRDEMEQMLDAVLDVMAKEDDQDILTDARKNKERILNALAGLPAYQASNAIDESLARTDRIDPATIQAFKKQLVAAQGITWIDPDPRGFNALGGLEPVKAWARKRQPAFDEKRRAAYGVRAPRGLIAGGKPGCAKSAFAKALASEWGMVLLRLDVGATRGMYQGQSEQAFDRAIKLAESVAPCILFVDEGEKAFGGVGGGGISDGGTSERVFGSFLTWLQEKTTSVFVYIAGNRMDLLPPEFQRAGRFDGMMWFDLPTVAERTAIVQVFQARYPKASQLDLSALVEASEDCTGAEIEACFEAAALTAMLEERDMSTEDLVVELKQVTRVNQTFKMSDDLNKWRNAAILANADVDEAAQPAQAEPAQRFRRRVSKNAN